MFNLPLHEKIKLKIAEKKMGLYMCCVGFIYKKQPGYQHYFEMLGFRRYCDRRTKIFLKNGGGKKIISLESMSATDGSDILNLDDFCVDGQSVHPDVIYDSLNQYYIMSISEFPYKNDRYENPVVLYSYDGTKWHSRKDYEISVVSIPPDMYGYHSDPGVLLHKEKLYFFDRKVVIDNDIVNITLHFFLKDVRPMQHPAKNHSTSVV